MKKLLSLIMLLMLAAVMACGQSSKAQSFLTRPQGNTERELKDKADILELLNFERYCRDNLLWDEMRKCFSPDSVVDISWYHGSGDGFVTASSELNRRSEHLIHNALTWINGKRAVTVMISTVQMRYVIEGVECELSADVQLHFCTEKIGGRWYIARFESIYEKDRLVPVLPDSRLSVDGRELARYRKSYACMSYAAEKAGMRINQELVGTDRPEMMKELRERLSAWLAEGSL